MRTTILVVPALLTPLATAQPPDNACEHSSSSAAAGVKVKVRNDDLADAWQAKKEFAGAVMYAASDYIVRNLSSLRLSCCLEWSC